jgi:hypothetical protein
MTKIEYTYSKVNSFIHPQKYQMTEFLGEEFLFSYKNSRLHILNHLENNFKILSMKKLILELKNILSKYDKNLDSKVIISTPNLLQIFITVLKNPLSQSEKNYIDKFLKKFEIKKKIFNSYDENFMVIDDTYDNLLNYLLLSGICELVYKENSNLKFINCSLKINDLICSQISKIDSLIPASLLNIILKFELQYIEFLIKKKKIDL